MAYYYPPSQFGGYAFGPRDVQIQMKIDIVAETPHGGIIVTNAIQSNDIDPNTHMPRFPTDWFGVMQPPSQQHVGTSMDQSRMIGWVGDQHQQEDPANASLFILL